MNVLVIGSSGQLARSLVEASPNNINVKAIGRPDFDIAQPDSLQQILNQFNPSVVVNAAAYTAVDKAQEEEELAYEVNANGIGAIAKLCEGKSIPLIHVSTDYVFDGTNENPYRESDAVAPLGVYGQSKLKGEQLIVANCSRYIILRTAWVYSPFGNNFVKTMLRLANSHDEISVVGDQIGNPTYAPHLAEAIFAIIAQLQTEDKLSELWGVYHASANGEASWYDFAVDIFNQSAQFDAKVPKVNNIPTNEYPTPAKRPANSRLDCSKLEKNFNVELPDWHIGSEQCVKRLST